MTINEVFLNTGGLLNVVTRYSSDLLKELNARRRSPAF